MSITHRGLLMGAWGGSRAAPQPHHSGYCCITVGTTASQLHHPGYHHIPLATMAAQHKPLPATPAHATLTKAMNSFVWFKKGLSPRVLGEEEGFPECWAADVREPCSLLSVFTLFNSCPLDHATSQATDNKADSGSTAKRLPTLL